jgi:uncharacterized protein
MNSALKSVIQCIIEILKIFFATHNVPESHAFEHAMAVFNHARQAVQHENLTDEEAMCVMLAALLHDADDRKYFKKSIDYSNARAIMSELPDHVVDSVIEQIKLVSFSSNGNAVGDKPAWKLIARYADRLESIGKIGVLRCLLYTLEVGRPLYRDDTPRFTSIEEMIAATQERAAEYVRLKGNVGESSFIDHFYDKLVHLSLKTGNEYIDKVSEARMQVIYNVTLEFGKKGYITKSDIEKYLD